MEDEGKISDNFLIFDEFLPKTDQLRSKYIL